MINLVAIAAVVIVGLFFLGRAATSTPEGAEMAIKALYCVFLGLLVVLFVAWAVIALYPTPAWETEYPAAAESASLISLLAAVVVMALGVGFSGRLPVIAEGFLLGGFFTLIFSIGFGFATSPRIVVIPVGVGLIVTIALGYKRFVRPAKNL